MAADSWYGLTLKVIDRRTRIGRRSSGPAGPINTVAPVITGTAKVGSTLSVSNGTWTGNGSITYAYQWLRNGTSISGATSSSYTLVSADDLTTVSCRVTASDLDGSTNATASGAIITQVAPVNTVAPVVSGATEIGDTLSVTTGTWTGNSLSYSYQWQRNTVNISGATGSTYVLVLADDATSIRCVVTAANSGGSASANSNAVSAGATDVAPVITGVPTISGTAEVGQTLTASPASVTGDPAPTRTWQWERNGTPISGATASTYTLVSADAGTDITVVQTETNTAGVDSAESAPTAVPVALILDSLSAGAAYSTRKLRTAYAGSAIRVRRSSDNTEQDIGFSGNALDTTALTAFVGANSGFVTTWYDQSGNARHVSQTTQANQPRIVNAGTIDTRNSVPSLVFDGADDHLWNTSPWLYNNTVMTAALVVAVPAPGATRNLVGEGRSNNNSTVYSFQGGFSVGLFDDMAAWVRNDAGTDLVLQGGTPFLANQFDDTLRCLTWRDDGSNFDGFGNNTQGTTRTYTRSGTLSPDRFCIGGLLRASFETARAMPMALSEAIFFTSALSTADRVAANTDQAGAYGITLNP